MARGARAAVALSPMRLAHRVIMSRRPGRAAEDGLCTYRRFGAREPSDASVTCGAHISHSSAQPVHHCSTQSSSSRRSLPRAEHLFGAEPTTHQQTGTGEHTAGSSRVPAVGHGSRAVEDGLPGRPGSQVIAPMTATVSAESCAANSLTYDADVVAHQVELVAALAVGWVNSKLGRWQGENEPSVACVN